jgi:hypothetical protein
MNVGLVLYFSPDDPNAEETATEEKHRSGLRDGGGIAELNILNHGCEGPGGIYVRE